MAGKKGLHLDDQGGGDKCEYVRGAARDKHAEREGGILSASRPRPPASHDLVPGSAGDDVPSRHAMCRANARGTTHGGARVPRDGCLSARECVPQGCGTRQAGCLRSHFRSRRNLARGLVWPGTCGARAPHLIGTDGTPEKQRAGGCYDQLITWPAVTRQNQGVGGASSFCSAGDRGAGSVFFRISPARPGSSEALAAAMRMACMDGGRRLK